MLTGWHNHAIARQPKWASRLEQTELLVKSRPDSAYILLKAILMDAHQRKDLLLEALCHQQIGQVFYNYSNYTQAVDHLLQAEKIFRSENERNSLARNLNYLGHVYYANKQPELASRQFGEALRIYKQLQELSGIAFTYGNIGHLFEKKLMYDSAYTYQKKALWLYRRANDSMGMAKIFENMGSIMEDWGKFDSARICFETALSINRQYNDEIAQIEIMNNLGDIYRKTGRFHEGLQFSQKALLLAEKTKSQYQLASAYRDMARGFELIRGFDSAYIYNERSRELVEQIYSTSNNQQIALLETVHEVEKKNSQIASLALGKKINAIIAISVASGVLLFIILGIAIISRQRLKIRNERELNTQNAHIYEKDRELMQAEIRNKYLEEEKLRAILEIRSKELSAHTLHLIQKNQLLEELRGKLNEIVNDEKRDQKKQLKQLIQKIGINFNHDQYWDEFRAIFDEVHQTFFINLKRHANGLTPADLRLVALLRLNLGSADIATLLGISQDSLRVARYRLRKKLNIAEGESVTAFIQRL